MMHACKYGKAHVYVYVCTCVYGHVYVYLYVYVYVCLSWARIPDPELCALQANQTCHLVNLNHHDSKGNGPYSNNKLRIYIADTLDLL